MPWDVIVYLPSYHAAPVAVRNEVYYALRLARAAMYREEPETRGIVDVELPKVCELPDCGCTGAKHDM